MPSLNTLLMAPTLSAALIAVPAAAEDFTDAADDTWISLSGTIDSVSADSFVLDSGESMITVEMDDADRDADGYKLISGDKVTVSGLVDHDLFDAKTLQASSVYVENAGTTFYASPYDKNMTWSVVSTPIDVSAAYLEGTVTAVGDAEFVLSTGAGRVEVETDEMGYDPLDDEGYQKIQAGDRVRVRGDVDRDLFEGQVFDATSVITLGGGDD